MLTHNDLVLAAVYGCIGELGINAAALLDKPLIVEQSIFVGVIGEDISVQLRLGRNSRIYALHGRSCAVYGNGRSPLRDGEVTELVCKGAVRKCRFVKVHCYRVSADRCRCIGRCGIVARHLDRVFHILFFLVGNVAVYLDIKICLLPINDRRVGYGYGYHRRRHLKIHRLGNYLLIILRSRHPCNDEVASRCCRSPFKRCAVRRLIVREFRLSVLR